MTRKEELEIELAKIEEEEKNEKVKANAVTADGFPIEVGGTYYIGFYYKENPDYIQITVGKDAFFDRHFVEWRENVGEYIYGGNEGYEYKDMHKTKESVINELLKDHRKNLEYMTEAVSKTWQKINRLEKELYQ